MGSRSPVKPLTAGAKLIEELDDLLPRGYDFGEVLMILGMSYEAALKNLTRHGRTDLVETAKEWRKADLDRVHRASGKTWW